MGVRKSVFGSDKERHCYQQLVNTWGKNYHLFHNLPFLNVFSCKTDLFDENLTPYRLSEQDYGHLKKASIDFTLCDKRDKPLVCVEFDGMQDGFNIGTTYSLPNGTIGKKGRRAMIELKLRIAHGFIFPYFVFGSEEFRNISDSLRLTIADGLIGEVMSLCAVNKRVNKGFDPRQCGFTEDEFSDLSSEQQSEVLGDWLSMIEIDSDCKYNPVVQEVMRLSMELNEIGHGWTFLNEESRDPKQWAWVECKATSSHGTKSAKVCLPNYKTPFCHYSIHVAMEIAHLMALEQLRKCLLRNGNVNK